jgi:hypothetical protein
MAILDTKDLPLEIHFTSESVSVQDGEVAHDFEISQLVRPGGLIVSIVQDEEAGSKKKNPQAIHLVAAENCEHSAGGQSLLSTVTGYPHVDSREEGDKYLVNVTVTPMVVVPEDRMKAAITVHPPVGDAPELTIEDLLLFLKEAGIVYGIDQRFLNKALEQVNRERKPVIDMVVAHAMPPINGFDAHLRMGVEIGSMPGKLRGDGSIDFRERRMFVSVEQGQLIATKINQTSGIPGKNVMGQLIPQKEGRDITIRVTEDAVYNEEDQTVRATKAGVVSIVKDNTIRVSSKQSISGDIDFSTGNIYSKNSVEIGGSVKQDFVVSARGDILVGSDIQSASVNSHGNLIVKGGVVGNSSINIRGDVDINFIENSTIHAGGNVVIRKSSYYSTIISDGNIAGDQKAKIVGGTLACSGSLTTGDIGSQTASAANITVGTDIKRYSHYKELHQMIVDLTEQTALWLQRYGPEAQKSNKMIEMEEELAKAKNELASLNLIPGSPENSMSEDYTVEDNAEILVYGEIYAGTKLRIGNITKTIILNQKNKKFRINNATNTIEVVPL